MAELSALPPRVTTLVPPVEFGPSHLASASHCRLRSVLATGTGGTPQLPAHPAAARGEVFHALLERANRGWIPVRTTSRRAVEDELDRLLDLAAERLSGQRSTSQFADLRSVFPAVEWHNACERTIRTGSALLDRTGYASGRCAVPSGNEPLLFEQLPEEGRWAEVRVRAPRLRLAGRMDVVEKYSGHRVIIRDYKTGQIFERDGSLRPDIEFQLRLYALAVLEHDPAAVLELFVFTDRDVRITLDEHSKSRTRACLEAILAPMAPGLPVVARSLASAGPHCYSCPFRHVCDAYLDAAPTLWTEGTEERPMPLDIWGELLRIDCRPDGVVLDLLDAAGRRVSVARVAHHHRVQEFAERGCRIWLFGLASRPLSTNAGRWFHPRNFYELPVHPSEKRAWSLAIYRSPND